MAQPSEEGPTRAAEGAGRYGVKQQGWFADCQPIK